MLSLNKSNRLFGLLRLCTRLKIYKFIIYNDARNKLLLQDTTNNILKYFYNVTIFPKKMINKETFFEIYPLGTHTSI